MAEKVARYYNLYIKVGVVVGMRKVLIPIIDSYLHNGIPIATVVSNSREEAVDKLIEYGWLVKASKTMEVSYAASDGDIRTYLTKLRFTTKICDLLDGSVV